MTHTHNDYVLAVETVADVFDDPAFPALRAEYEAECLRNEALAGLLPDREQYEALEELEMLMPVVIRLNGVMAGFCALIFAPSFHHQGAIMATAEALFVADAHRKAGAGQMLMETCEDLARYRKAHGLYMSAPVGGRLGMILPHWGYKTIATVYLKELDHG